MGILRWLFGKGKVDISEAKSINLLSNNKHKFIGPGCGYAKHFALICKELLHDPASIVKDHRIPPKHGVYGWYFDELPNVPPNDYYNCDGWNLLYIGIAGKSAKSSQNLNERIINKHLMGNADISTLRFSLGCLLRDKLCIDLIRKEGTKESVWFGEDGEKKLSLWIVEHARIAWLEYSNPKEIEDAAINIYGDVLPLNIEGNLKHKFPRQLRELRTTLKNKAL
ncbi:MAG: hypothetical protein JW709_11145 [Sedimentisphaerales bacterium]|nr:hypothetical protein [Sedimentisphaerales bacterium]